MSGDVRSFSVGFGGEEKVSGSLDVALTGAVWWVEAKAVGVGSREDRNGEGLRGAWAGLWRVFTARQGEQRRIHAQCCPVPVWDPRSPGAIRVHAAALLPPVGDHHCKVPDPGNSSSTIGGKERKQFC